MGGALKGVKSPAGKPPRELAPADETPMPWFSFSSVTWLRGVALRRVKSGVVGVCGASPGRRSPASISASTVARCATTGSQLDVSRHEAPYTAARATPRSSTSSSAASAISSRSATR
jgi:hypothetical protein